MNDIATASDKGRRTIYTYFKSKTEIFNAVIESETDDLLKSLRLIAARPGNAPDKLSEYVAVRLEKMKEVVSRNGSLRAGFFRDVRKVDRARNIIASKEISLLMSILQEGKDAGDFNMDNVKDTAIVITNMIHGMDVPYIRNTLAQYGIGKEKIVSMVTDLIFNGIRNVN